MCDLALVGAPSGAALPIPPALREVWAYRELLRNLVVRDLKVRYRSSVLGFVWSLFHPLLMMLVYTVVFTVLLRSAPAGVPYPVFILTGLLAWNFTSAAVMGCVGSIVGNAHLVKKIAFPRELLPIAAVLANAANFLLALLALFPVLLAFGVRPTGLLALLPVVFLGQVLFLIGIGLLLAAVNVYFRDTQVIMEVLMTAWFFLTPVFYDISQVWPEWNGLDLPRIVRIVNPMASFVTTYRDILLFDITPDPLFVLRTLATALGVLVVGYAVFRRAEGGFGDEL